MKNPSDAQLVLGSLEDPEAFGAIFDRHAEALLRYLVRRVGRTTAEKSRHLLRIQLLPSKG